MKKRKWKRTQSRKKFFLFVLFLSCIVSIGGGTYMVLTQKKDIYLSPIPKKMVVITQSSVPKKELLVVANDIKTTEDMLKNENIAYSSVVASDSAIFVVFKDGGTVVLSTRKDIPTQISSLQLVLYRFTIEGKRFAMLDFRFDRPVITAK